MSSVLISKPQAPLKATVHLPRSKSAANRALIIAALLGELDLVHDPGDGDDTRILFQHLRERGSGDALWCGCHHLPLPAGLGLLPGGEERLITGTERLLERPHDDLVNALRTLGAHIDPCAGRVTG
jgi:3-phosphoshikimate 1-carboxyvinyltransferase